MSKLDVAARERAIMKYLKGAASDGAPVKDIYDVVTVELGDGITLPAYYKILDRMVAAGKIEALREDEKRGRIYVLTPTLHIGNALTNDDIYEMLPYLETTTALAGLIDAQDYYEEHRETVLRQAAEALLREDPVELFHALILNMIDKVERDVAILRHQNVEGQVELADTYSQKRLEADYHDLERMVYRALSLPHEAIHLPGLAQIERGRDLEWDEDALRDALRARVFGETFIRVVDISPERKAEARGSLVVSGSDGSMHAGTLALQTASGYYEDTSNIVTFNNSVAYVRLSQLLAAQEGKADMVHSVPFTRQTIDDPSYKGMVLAPAMFPDLSEAEYEHMVRCATDVVQFRVDEIVFAGKAYDLRAPYQQIPRPQVHLRDGTITPQEREFGHYNRPDAYGEMVREGIRRERTILERMLSAGERAPVFAGAAKSTQLRVFGPLLNWYIAQGSRARFGRAIEPNWSMSRAAGISDNAAMTALLSSLPDLESRKTGRFYVTCVLARQFPALTEYYNYDDRVRRDWVEFFERKKKQALVENTQYGGTLPYHATVDLADDDFVFMCEHADYTMFYIGHSGGDPPPMLPRYEFLTSLRNFEEDGAAATPRVEKIVRKIVDALDTAGLALDRDHNYLTNKTLVKILPFPIQQAHEYSKGLGRKLESELKSIVIRRLIELKRLRAAPSEVEVRPVSVRAYLERFKRALDSKPEDQRDENR
ncbi:MAG: hypothetical protein WCD37_15950 [Chloroflexia bacterium]